MVTLAVVATLFTPYKNNENSTFPSIQSTLKGKVADSPPNSVSLYKWAVFPSGTKILLTENYVTGISSQTSRQSP